MAKALSIGGWVVAVMLLAGTAYLYRVNQDLNARLTVNYEEREGILAQINGQSEMIAELSRGLETAQARLQVLEQGTRRTEFSSFEALGEGVGQALGDLGAIFDVIGSGRALMGGESLVGLMQGQLLKNVSEDMARATVDMKYGDFIRSLGLDETRQAEVDKAFVRGMMLQLEQTSFALIGGRANEEGPEDAEADVLREHLAQVLTTEELERFDASRSDVRYNHIRRSFEVQLRVFAAGLTPESRERALDVFVEETVKTIHEKGISAPSSLFLTGQLDAQKTIFPRALDRLRNDLDDDQYAIIERFVKDLTGLLETSSKLLPGLFVERVSEDEAQ